MYRGRYTLIGQELSMFTRKLESQLRYQGIPFERQLKCRNNEAEINARAGTHFIPVLGTPDGWMINDTISVGPMLHARFNDVPVLPEGPAQRGACFVLEDFFNHWYPRHALHSRWCYPRNLEITGERFGMNILLGKFIDAVITDEERDQIDGFGHVMFRQFGSAACEVQGAGPEQSEAIRADFNRLLELLVDHFKRHDFLLGDRACLADFALVGPFKAHFLLDPEPLEWLGGHKATMEAYVNRVYAGVKSGATWLNNDALPDTLSPLFDYSRDHYQVFAFESISASVRGEKTFRLDLGDGPFVARSMRRLEKVRLHVQDELLRAESNKSVLGESGVTDFYMAEPILV